MIAEISGSHRDHIFSLACSEGRQLADRLYPYLVDRDIPEVAARAHRIANNELKKISNEANRKEVSDLFTSGYIQEYSDIVTSGYIKGYFERLAKLDKEAGKQTAAATASPTGVTANVLGVEREADKYIYTIEIIDPGHLTQPEVIKAKISEL